MTLKNKAVNQWQQVLPIIQKGIEKALEKVPVEKYLKKVPFVKARMEKEYATVMDQIEESVKPYKGQYEVFEQLPQKGRARQDILNDLTDLMEKEESRWKDGYVSGAVYHGDPEHIEFLNQVYALNSQSNPLHSDLWPSSTKFEAEIVSMTANMLGADRIQDQVCGTVSSGGTESIMLSMKTYRDWARQTKNIVKPEMITPITAHAAFDKAAQYFNIKKINVPLDSNYRADIKAVKKAITRNTIVIVGSAPSFPHGMVDPIEEMADLALKKGIGFHTDACLGGFILPFAQKLGYPVPGFDFTVPGVTSISADTHKFGYAAKGTSVILYRNPELRHFQYFTITNWPGGMYFSPTFAGSRPGALSAACWAAMLSIGEKGYMEAAQKILKTADTIKQSIKRIPGLYILGDPLWVIAFGSNQFDIYRVMDYMSHKNWNLNGLHHPSCVHLCLTLRHTQKGVAQRFFSDLSEAVEHVRAHPEEKGGMAPIYGMAATFPIRGVISDILKRYLDVLYKT